MAIRAPSAFRSVLRPGPACQILAPLGLLWALSLWPARLPGAAWWECLLAGVVLYRVRSVLGSGLAPIIREPFQPTDTLVTLATLGGCCESFLLAALEAFGRLPAHLQDPRGGPVLLFAASCTAAAIRFLARDAEARRGAPEASPDEADRGAPSFRERLLLAAMAGVAGLSLVVAAAWASTNGIAAVTAVVVAVLVAASPEGVKALGSLREIAKCQVESIAGRKTEVPDLQSAARVDWVLFDRSGVLTEGEPRVTDIHTLQPGVEREDVLHFTALAEYGVSHPIRDAILRSYHSQNRTVAPVKAADLLEERGVRATHQGRELLVGNLQLFKESGWAPAKLDFMAHDVNRWSSKGETVIFAAFGGELVGALRLEDPLRPEASTTLEGLRALDVQPAVHSGDAPESVHRLLGEIPDLEIHAGLAPGDDRRLLATQLEEGRIAATVRRCVQGVASGSVLLDWSVEPPPADWSDDSAEEEDSPDPSRSLMVPGDRLGDIVTFLSVARQVSRAERRALAVVGLHQLLLLPLLGGALLPWFGVPALPVVAAAAGALLPVWVRSLLPTAPPAR